MIHKKSFYFMRHGTTEYNLTGRLTAQLDLPLHEIGIQEAHQAVITQQDITHVFYSPLQRAQQTMQIVTKNLTCPKEVLTGISERHIGALAGQTREQLLTELNQLVPPGGESYPEFCARVVQAINHGLTNTDCPLFVAHGGVFRALIETLGLERQSLNNCHLVKFVITSESEQWTIELVHTSQRWVK